MRNLRRLSLLIYLALLASFVLWPRPLLETGDRSALALFLQNHANLFYKILYADPKEIAIANFFMLMPLPILIRSMNTKIKQFTTGEIIVIGALLSAVIELIQLMIPGRVSDWKDWILNVSGLIVVELIYKGLFLKRFNQSNLQ